MRSPLTWGIVGGLVLGKFIGITGATWLVPRFGLGSARARADAAPGRGRRGAVRNRFHHLAVHHRPRDRRSAAPGRGAGRRADRIGAGVRAGLGHLPDHRPDQPAGGGRDEAGPPGRPRPRPHPRRPRRAADPGRVRRLRVPVLQSGHRVDRRGARHTSATNSATCGGTCRWSGSTRARSTRPGPVEAAALQGKFWEMGARTVRPPGRPGVVRHVPLRRRAGIDIEQFDKDVRVHASKVLHRVQDDAQDAEVMDLNSTPDVLRQRQAAQGAVGCGQPDPRARGGPRRCVTCCADLLSDVWVGGRRHRGGRHGRAHVPVGAPAARRVDGGGARRHGQRLGVGRLRRGRGLRAGQ